MSKEKDAEPNDSNAEELARVAEEETAKAPEPLPFQYSTSGSLFDPFYPSNIRSTYPNVVYGSLDRLSKADRADVQEIAASQIGLLTAYHTLVLDQARRSFGWALIAAGVGLAFFLAAVGFLVYQQLANAALVSLVSGAVVEVISGINFYLYGKTSAQLAEFQNRLDATQRFLLANSICESLKGETKQQARWELIRAIAGVNTEAHLTNADAEQGHDKH